MSTSQHIACSSANAPRVSFIRVAAASMWVAVAVFGASCDPSIIIGPPTDQWTPQTMSLKRIGGEIFLSLTEVKGQAACDAADPNVSLQDAQQVIVSLGTEPFEPQAKISQPSNCPANPGASSVPAGCTYERFWGAGGNLEGGGQVTSAAITISTSGCEGSGCLIDFQVSLAGTTFLLLAELPSGNYPRCLDAGQFAWGPL